MDLDDILRVDRCRDMDELVNFWAISYALQRGILLRQENPTGMVIGRSSQQRRVVLRRRNIVVGGKYAVPSAILVGE